MTFHSLATLQSWVDEFSSPQGDAGVEIRVIVQDGGDGADTGLVEIKLRNASTVTTIEPGSAGSTRWLATFEAREAPIRVDAADVLALSQELALVSELCLFLERKAAPHVTEESGPAPDNQTPRE